MPDGGQIVTHSITLEILKLEETGSAWQLVFGDDGFGALINEATDPARVELLEDRLKYQLWVDDGGMHYIISGIALAPTIVQLAAFREKWVEVQLSLCWGASRSNHTLTAVFFKWHRFGARLFVSMTSLYAELGLQQFNGRAWRWTQGCKRWGAWLASIGLPDQIAYSNLVARA